MKPERPLKEFVNRREDIMRRVHHWTPECANALHEVLQRYAEPIDPVTMRPMFTLARDGDHTFQLIAVTGDKWLLEIGPAVIISRQAPDEKYPHIKARYDVLVMDGLEGEFRTYGEGDRAVQDWSRINSRPSSIGSLWMSCATRLWIGFSWLMLAVPGSVIDCGVEMGR